MTRPHVLPDRLAVAVRTAYHAGISRLRGTAAGRVVSDLLGRHLPGLKARLVRRYVVYDRTLQQFSDDDPDLPQPARLPPPPADLGDAERAVFLRLTRRTLQSAVRG